MALVWRTILKKNKSQLVVGGGSPGMALLGMGQDTALLVQVWQTQTF